MAGDDDASFEAIGDVLLASEATANAKNNLDINNYLIEKSLALAECEITFAEELYAQHREIRQLDCHPNFDLMTNYQTYRARGFCGMAMANGDVIRANSRDMHARLAATGMYNNGKSRDIIENAMGRVVDESGAQMALAYREEERIEDQTYYAYMNKLNSLVDRGSLYVGTRAMASVADNQLLLAAKAARAAEKSIASATASAVRVVDSLIKDKDIFTPRATRPTDQISIGINGKEEPWFGTEAPVRPDNPGGYAPPIVPPPSQGGSIGGESISIPGGQGGV